MFQSVRVVRTFDAEPVVLFFIAPLTAIYGALILVSPPGPVTALIPMPWYAWAMVAAGLVAFVGIDNAWQKVTLFGIAGCFFALGWLSVLVIQLPGSAPLTSSLFLPIVIASAWAFLRILLDPIRAKAETLRSIEVAARALEAPRE